MTRRLLDVALAGVLLVLTSPVILATALLIFVVSPGSVLFRPTRVGLHGRTFTMFKLRTMRLSYESGVSAITAKRDPRLIPLARWVRRFKLDELPQLLNILKGDMAVVGPRPRHPRIVSRYRTAAQRETLEVLPGLTSPGSIYALTHGEEVLDSDDPETVYLKRVLPTKLALDVVYVRESSPAYDVRIVFRTVGVILNLWGAKSDPPELERAKPFIEPVDVPGCERAHDQET